MRTGTGTASSMAALIVHRPSPESETRPANCRERGIFDQGGRRQVEQPRGDHAAAPPHLGDVAQVEVVLVVLGVAQRRRFRVDLVESLADVGAAQDAQALGVGGHDAVFDAVVDHLDEVPGPRWPAVQVALLGGAADLLASRRARDVADAGRQRLEDRIEVLDRLIGAADHHAVAAFQAPDTAAGPHVHVVDPLRSELLGAADVVHVVGIAAVDEDVSCLEIGQEVSDGLVHDSRRDHQPDRSRLFQFLDEVLQRGRSHRLFLDQFFHRFRRHVEDHALVPSLEEPSHHVRAHPSESDHSELHV